jgi:hypothetical protein
MKYQRGYLLEVPLIVMVIGILLAILIPILPKVASKVFEVISAIILIAAFYYMIVIPGWQPNASRLGQRGKLITFSIISLLIILFTVLFLIS